MVNCPSHQTSKASVAEIAVCTWNDACPVGCQSEKKATIVGDKGDVVSKVYRCLGRCLVRQACVFVVEKEACVTGIARA